MVNEVALTLLFGLFGWRVALLYLSLGLAIAVVAGWVMGRLKMETSLEDWVRGFVSAETEHLEDAAKMLRTM